MTDAERWEAMLAESKDENDREMEIFADETPAFERLMGGMAAYEATCEKYISGQCGPEQVKQTRAVVAINALEYAKEEGLC